MFPVLRFFSVNTKKLYCKICLHLVVQCDNTQTFWNKHV